MKKFKLGFRQALIVNLGTRHKAYYDFCTHQGGALKIRDGKFECVRHQATFEIESGKALTGPAPEDSFLGEIPLIIEGDDIFCVWQLPE